MNRVDVPRETAARRPLIRSQTRFSPPLPPSSPIMKPDIITLDPITSIPAILLSSQFRPSRCSAIQQRRIQLSREFYSSKNSISTKFLSDRSIAVQEFTRILESKTRVSPFRERERELRFPFLPRILLPRGGRFRWRPRKCFPFDATWPLGFAKCGQHQLLP